MRIKEITINDKTFDFNNESTLIYSKQNSVGKTTLLRLIFFALGYNIPSTRGLKFKNFSLKLKLSENGQKIEVNRKNTLVTTSLNTNKVFSSSIDEDQDELHSMLFGIDIPEVVHNLLGLIYFDQEKGWTLLNRGSVIGSIHFQIEELIEGLDKSNLMELRNRVDKLSKERKIYKQLNKLLELQGEYEGQEYNIDDSTTALQGKYKSLQIEITRLKKEISDYLNIKKQNETLIDLIEQSGIRILIDKKEIPVTQENIVGYSENQHLIDAILTRERLFLKEYEREFYRVRDQLNKKLELVDVSDQLQRFNSMVSSSEFNSKEIDLLISKHTDEIDDLNRKIREELYAAKATAKIYNRIKKYSELLHIEDSIDEKKDFIFTSDLKRYTGAKLHLLVFAFKLALLKEVQNQFKVCLPIVLDSPKTGELDENNLNLMFRLLKREFPDNQIIIASVTSPEEFSNVYSLDNTIEIHKRLLE